MSDIDDDYVDEFFDKMRHARKLSPEEAQEQREDLVDKIINDPENDREKWSNNTGREAQDITVEELKDKDQTNDKRLLDPVGYYKMMSDLTGKQIGIGFDHRESEFEAIEAGYFCAKCLQPQVEIWTEFCQPKNLGGKAISCGQPRLG